MHSGVLGRPEGVCCVGSATGTTVAGCTTVWVCDRERHEVVGLDAANLAIVTGRMSDGIHEPTAIAEHQGELYVSTNGSRAGVLVFRLDGSNQPQPVRSKLTICRAESTLSIAETELAPSSPVDDTW